MIDLEPWLKSAPLAAPSPEFDGRVERLFEGRKSQENPAPLRWRARGFAWATLAIAVAIACIAVSALHFSRRSRPPQVVHLAAEGDLLRYLQADLGGGPPPTIQVRVKTPHA